MTWRSCLVLWAIAALAMAPLSFSAQDEVVTIGVVRTLATGLCIAAVGFLFMYLGRARPDKGLRSGLVAVLVFCALLWGGALTT